eukprot:Skav208566  [mRNA]  locus=scaffold177:85410:88269:+ [translate_table: standard]
MAPSSGLWGALLLSTVVWAGIPRRGRGGPKLPAGRDLADSTLKLGLTSQRFKQELGKSLEDCGGATTAALAVNFGVVLATETYWHLEDAVSRGNQSYVLERSKLLRGDGSSFSNIVNVHLDASAPHSFSIFATQNVSACVIDAQHDFEHVVKDTFAVLRNIPCCVETIVYHDYCPLASIAADGGRRPCTVMVNGCE